MHTWPLSFVLLVLSLPILRWFRNRTRTRPPGPRGFPLLGNVLNIPRKDEWRVYTEWSQKFDSDILYLNLCGTSMIILNSARAVSDLLEKRSAIYSGRPPFVMFNKTLECSWNILFMPCNGRFKALRRLFNKFFRPSVMPNLRPRMLKHTSDFLCGILDNPDNFQEQLKHTIASSIFDVTFGLRGDKYLAVVEHFGESFEQAAMSQTLHLLFEWFPILARSPSWVPFMKNVMVWKENFHTLRSVAFLDVKAALAKGMSSNAIIPDLLEREEKQPESLIQDFGGAIYAGGHHTIISLLEIVIYALSLHPEIQKSAQESLDKIISEHGRLPDFCDTSSLPYITAIIKEAIRWQPITPLAFPHYLSQDDMYEGYHIPAGSIVVGNVWAMCRDEDEYPDPDQFNPERFISTDGNLNTNVRDPETFAFGFGRRVCPGKYFALETVWIIVARMLAVYQISRPSNLGGSLVPLGGEFVFNGTLSHPRAFKCSFKPRSPTSIDLITSAKQ